MFNREYTKYLCKTFNGKSLVGAEIGVKYGLNAIDLMRHLNLRRLYLVDIATDLFKCNVVDIPFVRVIECESRDCYVYIEEGLDFVYIDASHDYSDVKEDVELAWVHTKPGGVVGGHDFTGYYSGVARAVIEFADLKGLTLMGNNNDWWFVK